MWTLSFLCLTGIFSSFIISNKYKSGDIQVGCFSHYKPMRIQRFARTDDHDDTDNNSNDCGHYDTDDNDNNDMIVTLTMMVPIISPIF